MHMYLIRNIFLMEREEAFISLLLIMNLVLISSPLKWKVNLEMGKLFYHTIIPVSLILLNLIISQGSRNLLKGFNAKRVLAY